MTRCTRCGQPFELRRPGDYHCLRCTAEVAALIAPKPAAWVPVWMRRPFPKVLA
jgi:DNA-directed RNA polymerase subunit RPC12/RpoP